MSDSGIGIAEETLEHVFEPFFTTKEIGKGTGLGLSMVHGFAKQSGGNVTITSGPGEGTRVELYLPRSVAHDEETIAARPPRNIPSGEGERVLIVEDDADVRALAVDLLLGLGYEPVEADTAQAALEAIERTASINLLLSDVVLPGAMNGPDLAAEIRRRSPATKIVYMTGYAEQAFNNRGASDEPAHIIQKPFSKMDLARAIRSVMEDGGTRA